MFKKFKTTFLLGTVLVFPSTSFAQEASGVIEVMRLCGYGVQAGNRWARTLQFRIDGKWFAIFADYNGSSSAAYFEHDDNHSMSLLMLAYSQQKVVDIKATYPWNANLTQCGASSVGAAFYENAGDYIQISNQ